MLRPQEGSDAREALAKAARSIFAAGVAAVDPRAAVRRALSVEDGALVVSDVRGGERRLALDGFDRVIIVGAGKAGAAMARGVEEVFGDRVVGGIVVVKYGHRAPTDQVELVEAGHPLPDEAGVAGTARILREVADADERTLVICVISGGASALLTAPAAGISLTDLRASTEALLAAGADIGAINAVRKHLSRVKGGQLARLAAPAPVVSLILSDIVGDPEDDIASGPTVGDVTTFADARDVLKRFGLWGGVGEDHPAARAAAAVPEAVCRHLEAGIRGEIAETPGPDLLADLQGWTAIVGNNREAIAGARRRAEALGWRTLVLTSALEGEAREVARVLAAVAREAREVGDPLAPPLCVISGGEPTVTLRRGGDGAYGKGGRNQELALAAALAIEGFAGVTILSGGTDGTDGPTDAAGALVFGDTVARAASAGHDARACLDAHDAYPLFAALGDLLETGPTGTNVMDLQIVLVAPLGRRDAVARSSG